MLQLKLLSPTETIPALYLAKGITEEDFAHFTKIVGNFRQGINEQESEEHQKNNIATFLEDLYYKPDFQLNTRYRTDLAIHIGKTGKESVGVLIECKKANNKAEMISEQKPVAKALLELILYYFEEREKHQNFEIQHLIITNSHEWYVFKERTFDKFFYQNTALKRLYAQGKTSDFFYTEAGKILENADFEIEATYINFKPPTLPPSNLEGGKSPAPNWSGVWGEVTETEAVAVYKLLSPAYLLRTESIHDSNTLNREFYNELLHILGLEEVKDGGKILIKRIQNKRERHEGSLIENAIFIFENRERWKNVPDLENYGDTLPEQIESMALELCITWLNRILFLKLLEGQLISYHQESENLADIRFVNDKHLADFNQVNDFFFDVLAKKTHERTTILQQKYAHVPYLNSSLFELTTLEKHSFDISALKNHAELAYFSQTVLRQDNNKRKTGSPRCLPYLLAFLNAYDFAKEGKTLIKKETKTLINAAVLGLIFEKLNGYQDGSFFTPSHITMYMCREVVRKAVVQKFNEVKGWNCETIQEISNKLDLNSVDEYLACNTLFNSLKICDPAVGSGHFLVSVLNELMLIKSELKILIHPNGRRLKTHNITIENDELVLKDRLDGSEFSYSLRSAESQEIQETLFYEKKALIENCLFGVDINPKSVHICRLRLWIELLKNAFYKIPQHKNDKRELETLPNLDINIKAGNSLVSRFAMRENLLNNGTNKQILEKYKLDVATYKNFVGDLASKGNLRQTIEEAKNKFKTSMSTTNPLLLQLKKLEEELYQKGAVKLLDVALNAKQKEQEKKEIEKISEKIEQIKTQIELQKNNPIYKQSLEWRFEFPEILDEEGNLIGFDVVVGNPPYFAISRKAYLTYLKDEYKIYDQTADIYTLFIERAIAIVKPAGWVSFIISNKWLRTGYGEKMRGYLLSNTNPIQLVDFGQVLLFDNATVHTCILSMKRESYQEQLQAVSIAVEKDKLPENFSISTYFENHKIALKNLTLDTWNILSETQTNLLQKVERVGKKLVNWNININFGIKTGYNEAFIIDNETKNTLVAQNPQNEAVLKPILRGRDTRKYYCNFANLWLINTFNGTLIKSVKAIKVKTEADGSFTVTANSQDISATRVEELSSKKVRINRVVVEKDFPDVYAYLQRFEKEAKARLDQGEHWTNLRNCAYTEEFEKEKIIFSEIVSEAQFYYDTEGYYPEATVFFITGDSLKYLTALLNSKPVTYFFKNFYAGGDLVGKFRYKKAYLEQLPIPQISPEAQTPFIDLVSKIMDMKAQNPQADTSAFEREIDGLACTLYELTEEEKALVLGL
jgi:hypothetical protein